MGLGNDAEEARGRIVLASGRRVQLISLRQSLTYAGWLDGAPGPGWNDRIIEGLLREATQDAARYGDDGSSPILIPPTRRNDLRQPGDMDGMWRPHGEPPEWLPSVGCIGVLRDSAPARDLGKDGSVLTVMWYQDRYAFPIEESALSQIRSIDWERSAMDFEY